MPRLREDYEFPKSNVRETYPYDQLLDGQKWQCILGEDFKCSSQSFSQSLYSAARRHNKVARCKLLADGSVMVQARPMTEEEIAKEEKKREAKKQREKEYKAAKAAKEKEQRSSAA